MPTWRWWRDQALESSVPFHLPTGYRANQTRRIKPSFAPCLIRKGQVLCGFVPQKPNPQPRESVNGQKADKNLRNNPNLMKKSHQDAFGSRDQTPRAGLIPRGMAITVPKPCRNPYRRVALDLSADLWQYLVSGAATLSRRISIRKAGRMSPCSGPFRPSMYNMWHVRDR